MSVDSISNNVDSISRSVDSKSVSSMSVENGHQSVEENKLLGRKSVDSNISVDSIGKMSVVSGIGKRSVESGIGKSVDVDWDVGNATIDIKVVSKDCAMI